MTSRETAERVRAELDAELDLHPHFEHGQPVVIATALTHERDEWRVIVYVLEGAELPTTLRKFVDSRRDTIDLVTSSGFNLE